MYDELTQVDIDKMQQELDQRTKVLMPQLIEQVKVARAFGDLSENFEYKAAKQELNRNKSRVRYLERMIKTAKVIPASVPGGGIQLFDKVTIWIEEDQEEQVLRLVTTLRQDPLNGYVSKESPIGKALCHFLLQCMKVKSESKVAQSCLTFSDSMDCSPPGSSVHGIFQARVLEWGAIAFSVCISSSSLIVMVEVFKFDF